MQEGPGNVFTALEMVYSLVLRSKHMFRPFMDDM